MFLSGLFLEIIGVLATDFGRFFTDMAEELLIDLNKKNWFQK
jgi:hypothetical protein